MGTMTNDKRDYLKTIDVWNLLNSPNPKPKTVMFTEYNSNEPMIVNCVGFDINGDIINFTFKNATRSSAYVVNRDVPIQVM